jgi:hypothetical protein
MARFPFIVAEDNRPIEKRDFCFCFSCVIPAHDSPTNRWGCKLRGRGRGKDVV